MHFLEHYAIGISVTVLLVNIYIFCMFSVIYVLLYQYLNVVLILIDVIVISIFIQQIKCMHNTTIFFGCKTYSCI